MSPNIDDVEKRRLSLQVSLDSEKSQLERNRLGQFATPTRLAEDILRYADFLLPANESVRFLDPAIGTGSFYSALLRALPETRVAEALGFEIDTHYGGPSQKLWEEFGLTLRGRDFTNAAPTSHYNLVICNPPYVRHHHLQDADKARLQLLTKHLCGVKISGLAGLYCYFLLIAHQWMAPDGIAGWLIPSEFMDVNYGRALKHYLLNDVTLLHIHRFDPSDVQFADALVSSAVVWFRNAPPPQRHEVKFTFGGTLFEPNISRQVSIDDLVQERKWTRFPLSGVRARCDALTLSDFFHIKRGVATGDNRYFILSEEEIAARDLPMELFTPILPSPRYHPQDEVTVRDDGSPDIERRRFLLDTKLSEQEIQSQFPALFRYLEEGQARGIHQRYLCSRRSPWYAQEQRPAAPLVCTYLGRRDAKSGRPFRFIWNRSQATIANVYLAMYPTARLRPALDDDPCLIRNIWETLNRITPAELLGEGRVYGGGLHKLEPRELGNVNANFIADLIPGMALATRETQLDLF